MCEKIMGIKAGLVGLPNVGKSTLFNALTKSQVPAENYPFCTIDPHLAITEVPDARINKLVRIYTPKKIVPATVTFVDIAGLVKGAASGEGLGNQFLGHIQDVNVILHVLRCFEDPSLGQAGETIDPIADYEIIIAELMLKDLESVDKRLQKLEDLIKRHQSNPAERKAYEKERELLQKIQVTLNAGDTSAIRKIMSTTPIITIPILSSKEFLIIANISEHEIEDDAYKNNSYYQELIKQFGQEKIIPISAKTEYELSQLSDEDSQELMTMIGLKEKGLDEIIRATYEHLGLITFFTCGPKEVHAWPIKRGTTIRQAAGEIHSDLERGFICAEIFNCKDLFEIGSEAKLKELGKFRTEGQDYPVQDGDIVLIRFAI